MDKAIVQENLYGKVSRDSPSDSVNSPLLDHCLLDAFFFYVLFIYGQ